MFRYRQVDCKLIIQCQKAKPFLFDQPKQFIFILQASTLNFKFNFMAPFYGWGSTVSRPRLEPLRGGSLLLSNITLLPLVHLAALSWSVNCYDGSIRDVEIVKQLQSLLKEYWENGLLVIGNYDFTIAVMLDINCVIKHFSIFQRTWPVTTERSCRKSNNSCFPNSCRKSNATSLKGLKNNGGFPNYVLFRPVDLDKCMLCSSMPTSIK